MSEVTKRIVEGVFVKLLFHKQMDRGMMLAEYKTRCIRVGEIHEIVTTDQTNEEGKINQVGFLGFAEILQSGIIEKGDSVYIGGNLIGKVVGFDECHFPNHYNIVIAANKLITAMDIDLAVEEKIYFI